MPFNSTGPRRRLILASTSQTRRDLLQRLALDFECIPSDINEDPRQGESATSLALRLARQKAETIATWHPNDWVIGSDQVAMLDGQVLGKPMTVENAHAQLTQCSGRTVRFETAISLQCYALQHEDTQIVPFSVTFRTLTSDEISRYIEREEPLLCAGSFKCEGLGISLFSHLHGEDQTALMGLPLLVLCSMLRRVGLQLP
jgi:septum formation protein